MEFSVRGFACRWKRGFMIYNNFFYGRAYCFALRCAAANVTSLSFNKEVTKKMNSDVPSEPSLLCRSAKRKRRKT